MDTNGEPLEPPSAALREFSERLWQIAAQMMEFRQRPLHTTPHGEEAVRRELRRHEEYFQRHLANLVVECCRRLIRVWYDSESGKIGEPPDHRELIRVIARRFPIILRQCTPSPLADYMDLPAFETRILMLVEETLRPQAKRRRARAMYTAESLANLANWDRRQLKAALRIVRGRHSLREMSEATANDNDSSKVVPETIRQATLHGVSKLKPATQDKLAYAARKLLAQKSDS
jgi:hypothetical protein